MASWHRVRSAIALSWICFSLSAAAANPLEVDRGLAWLAQQVQPNGTLSGESASAATVFQARVESLTTLRQLSSAPPSLADLVAQEPALAVEILGRKAGSLAALGRDVSAATAALLARQNADGGFGGAQGYQSNPLDTAFALLALKAAGSTQSAAIGGAVAYLQSSQAPNGSFAIAGEPLVYVTFLIYKKPTSRLVNTPIQRAGTKPVGRAAIAAGLGYFYAFGGYLGTGAPPVALALAVETPRFIGKNHTAPNCHR